MGRYLDDGARGAGMGSFTVISMPKWTPSTMEHAGPSTRNKIIKIIKIKSTSAQIMSRRGASRASSAFGGQERRIKQTTTAVQKGGMLVAAQSDCSGRGMGGHGPTGEVENVWKLWAESVESEGAGEDELRVSDAPLSLLASPCLAHVWPHLTLRIACAGGWPSCISIEPCPPQSEQCNA